MGPRPGGRGNGRSQARASDCSPASMGPRPRGRGNGPVWAGSEKLTKLQWGRDRAVAEMLRPSPGAAVLCASMGPRPRGRGNYEPACALNDYQSLQWGRDRAVAEMTVPVPPWEGSQRFNGAATARSRKLKPRSVCSRASSCFNGAATARSRKCVQAGERTGQEPRLQWGRDRAVAEMVNLVMAARKSGAASMGPRPRGRGNPPLPIGTRRRLLLQWGRDRAVAEIAHSLSYSVFKDLGMRTRAPPWRRPPSARRRNLLRR